MTRDQRPRTRDQGLRAALALALTCLATGWSAEAQELPAEDAAADAARQKQAMGKLSPVEIFGEADYLVRSGQGEQAVPYLEAFLKLPPDDATMLRLRDQYGPGALLRLRDNPSTAKYARPLVDRLNAAQQAVATRPDRLDRFVKALHATPAEQRYAVERLREAGPYAVPAILAELKNGAVSSRERAMVASNLGRLDRSAVPPLIAALDSPDATMVSSAADALGEIGDRRALPYLAIRAAAASPDAPGRQAARRAIERLTGQSYAALRCSPVQLLSGEAWKYERHQIAFPTDTVELWTWDVEQDAPVPTAVASAIAETTLGLRMAREALALEPADVSAQAALVSLALDSAVAGAGLENFPAEDPSGAYATALASGPVVLGEVLSAALCDDHADLAAAAATALGRITDRDALTVAGRRSPLIDALGHPDRRVQFAAARALIELEPQRPFAGSSRVVPVLTRFLADPTAARAVIIDGNVSRANRLAASFRKLGYDPQVATTGEDGFRLAASGADVELIALNPEALQGAWRTVDTLTNLRADARTAGLPLFLLYPVDTNRRPSVVEPIRPHPDVEPNDSQRLANPILFSGGVQQARVLGLVGERDAAGDYYRLGTIDPGITINVEVQLPPGSLLTLNDLAVTVEGSDERPLAQAAVGRLAFPVATSDTYYVRVQAPAGSRGLSATYTLLITLIDPQTLLLANERMQARLESMAQGLCRVVPLPLSLDPQVLKRQLDREQGRMGVRPLSDAERTGYAQAAAGLLGRISGRPGSPFVADLDQAGPALAAALNSPAVAPAATLALADVPGPEAQRGLANLLLDPSQPVPLRLNAANQLARSVARFGDLMTAEQEEQLVADLDREGETPLRVGLSQVIGALRPKATQVGQRLRLFQATPGAAAPTPPAPLEPDTGVPPDDAPPAANP